MHAIWGHARLGRACVPVRLNRAAALADRAWAALIEPAIARRPEMRSNVQTFKEGAILVHSGGPEHLYQIIQWEWCLSRLAEALHREGLGGVSVLFRDPRAARRYLSGGGLLPVRLERSTASLSSLLREADPSILFYTSQATLNFQALSAPRPAHVHLSHGESEKISMVSNQLKSYDFVFTAGLAARHRIVDHLVNFPVDHFVDVGRPQLDAPSTPPSDLSSWGGKTVFYAPTWEGNSPTMSYSSLVSAGNRIVDELIRSGVRVIYRPHPQTGVCSTEYARADFEVRRRLVSAGSPHYVDAGQEYGWQWSQSDAALVDMSAVALDAVAKDVPVAIVAPSSTMASVRREGLLKRLPVLDPESPRVRDALDSASSEVASRVRHDLAAYHFGDTTPGSQIARFIEASLDVARDRRGLLSRHGLGYSNF